MLLVCAGVPACASQLPAGSANPQAAQPAQEGASAQPSTFAEPPPSAPTASSAGEAPKTVEEALAQLDRAQKELDMLGPDFKAKADTAGTSQQGAGTPLSQRAPGSTEEARGQGCFSACRALASMSRATEHLCQLAGSTDSRCEDAKDRLANAHKRVTDACTCQPAG